MEEILQFFGWFRLLPTEFYTFYSYQVEREITRQRQPFKRTLEMIARSVGQGVARERPDAFSPKVFPSTPEPYSYY